MAIDCAETASLRDNSSGQANDYPHICVLFSQMGFSCLAFSLATAGAELDSAGHVFIFCWAFSFTSSLVILLLMCYALISEKQWGVIGKNVWKNITVTLTSYAFLLCLCASIGFPSIYLRGSQEGDIQDYRVASTIFSFLATVAYLIDVILTWKSPESRHLKQYMTTTPGKLMVCETFVASSIFLLISHPVSYTHYLALKLCVVVYSLSFILSTVLLILCMFKSPSDFPDFRLSCTLLAVIMYLVATVIWPVYQFSNRYGNQAQRPPSCSEPGVCPWDRIVAVAVFTAVNLLLYLADLVYILKLGGLENGVFRILINTCHRICS